MGATQQAANGLLILTDQRVNSQSLLMRIHIGCVHLGIRCFMVLYGAAMALAKLIGPSQRTLREKADVLVTATFYSPNWIGAHLHPLAASSQCRRIWMVATSEVPSIEKVEPIYPPRLLMRMVGKVPARLLMFSWIALRRRPDVIGGFHLLLNGMLAALLAKLCGSHVLYICGGGPREVLDGGIWGENRLFRRLVTPDAFVEHRLLRAVNECDYVVTMGRKAGQFFRSRGVDANIYQNPGGIDGSIFRPGACEKRFDVVIVGRISKVKRIDTFLRAIAILRDTVPEVRAAVVGDGPLRQELEILSKQLSIEDNVHFAGQQSDIARWLQASRIFALTSDSEGVSLAMMEAMSCGLPVVVSRVGDLDEMVTHGENGFLVSDRTPENFAASFGRLIEDQVLRERMSAAARDTAGALEYSNAGKLWDCIFANDGLS
jgi:glycosyltransferase involved in cell wall biosynthesis